MSGFCRLVQTGCLLCVLVHGCVPGPAFIVRDLFFALLRLPSFLADRTAQVHLRIQKKPPGDVVLGKLSVPQLKRCKIRIVQTVKKRMAIVLKFCLKNPGILAVPPRDLSLNVNIHFFSQKNNIVFQISAK